MTKEEANALLPRFLNAVTSMAKSRQSLRRRLAWVIEDLEVFFDSEIPEDIKEQFIEFKEIINTPVIPEYLKSNAYYPNSVAAGYLTPRQAKRATELVIAMFETILYAACAD